MNEPKRPAIHWMDVLWLLLLALLAVLPPVREYHKQLILLGFGVLQLSESRFIARLPRRGPVYVRSRPIQDGAAGPRGLVASRVSATVPASSSNRAARFTPALSPAW